MIERDLNKITEDDLQYLIDEEVPEGRNLEYKGTLNLSDSESKRKLLKTVSAFANTSGGVLIYGISEENGIPKSLEGLKIDLDAEIRKITDVIRTRSEPTITSPEIYHLKLSGSNEGNVILLLKIPKSWAAPHRVRMNGSKIYYIRINNKSEEMDVEELRMAFNLSETITDRIRTFREGRLSKIMDHKTPIIVNEGAKLVIHLIPVNSFNPNQNYDLSGMEMRMDIIQNILPMTESFGAHNYNFDGFLTYNMPKEVSNSYVQLYRNGIIEIVEGSYDDSRKSIFGIFTEDRIVNSISNSYLNALKNLGVEPPIFIFLSLMDVEGYSMPNNYDDDVVTVDRDLLQLPEVFAENYDVNVGNLLKTAFDSVYNACGLEKSPHYDENGEWKQK
jgi:hypothetical protein